MASTAKAEVAVPSGVAGRLAVAGLIVCTAVGLLFASHFRLYYGVEWSLALWWGLKDWYLWGLLAPAVVRISWRAPLVARRWPRNLLAHLAAAFALAWLHPVLAITLSAVAEGLGEVSWAESVHGLFMKRYAVNLVTYATIVAVGHVLASRWSVRAAASETPQPSPRPPAAGPEALAWLLVRKGDRERLLETTRIDRIEAEGNYVRLHTGDESYLERRTLQSLEDQLDPRRFFRIHRSHLVNVERVDRIESRPKTGYEVVLVDGTRLPLGRTYRKRLTERVGKSV